MCKLGRELVWIVLVLVACGPGNAPSGAGAEVGGAGGGALGDAERRAMLQELGFHADASGQVENACGSRVAPQFAALDLGGDVGTAQLVVVPNGDTPACYGDGPGLLRLVRRDGASFRQVYGNQGGYLALLTTRTRGVRDLAHAGPGFEHPVYAWDGSEYAPTDRIVPDAEIGEATILP